MGGESIYLTKDLVQELEAGRLEIALLGAGNLVLVLSLAICIWIEARRYRDVTKCVDLHSSRTRWTSGREEGLPHTNSRRPVRSVMKSVRRKPPSFPRCVNLLAGYAQRKMSVSEVPLHSQESSEIKPAAAGSEQMTKIMADFTSNPVDQGSQDRDWRHTHVARNHSSTRPESDVSERPRGRPIRRAGSPLGRVAHRR